jgi:hypothetical protein
MSSYPAHSEVYWIQLYVIKFVSDLRQVGGVVCVLRFPPPFEGMSDEQKEYEAMKLVDAMDKLHR